MKTKCRWRNFFTSLADAIFNRVSDGHGTPFGVNEIEIVTANATGRGSSSDLDGHFLAGLNFVHGTQGRWHFSSIVRTGPNNLSHTSHEGVAAVYGKGNLDIEAACGRDDKGIRPHFERFDCGYTHQLTCRGIGTGLKSDGSGGWGRCRARRGAV